MNNKGFTLIESLLFFLIITLSVQYVSELMNGFKHLETKIERIDEKYEEAYK